MFERRQRNEWQSVDSVTNGDLCVSILCAADGTQIYVS